MVAGITFQQWLKQRRKALGLTQEALAGRIGTSVEVIRKLEAGTRRPSTQVAELLADVFEIPPAQRHEFNRFARGLPQAAQAAQASQLPTTPVATQPPQTETALPPDNLPAQLTRFIGREAELAELQSRLLQDEVRLLTLTGPPGTGKTRLATEAAERVKPQFEGVYFVPLEPLDDAGLVFPTIARTLGLKDTGSQSPMQVVEHYLHARRVLLLLDNFEQVMGAARSVLYLVTSCPGVKVLVTSREPLNVRGEQQFPVDTLAVPDADPLPPLDRLLDYPAVALFVDRASSVRADFSLTLDNAEAIAQVCRRLDGLALAIELAAARTRVFTPQQIAARLDHRLNLLTGGSRDMPPRQQTLRAAIEWSYNLLAAGEQTLLRRMSVFAGGFSLSAVEATCNPNADLPLDVLDGIGSLLDKSLVRQGPWVGEQARFTMLETIREYAEERLAASGEAPDIRRSHAEYYLALAESAGVQFIGSEQAMWLDLLEADHDNVRSALRWAIDCGEADFAAQLCGALWQFWSRRGYYREGRDWVLKALSMPGAGPARQRAKALAVAGFLAYVQGDFAAMPACFDESLSISRQLGYTEGEAYALEGLGIVAHHRDDYPLATSRFNESMALFERLGDTWGTANSLFRLGNVALNEGRYADARQLHEQSLRLRRSVGDSGRIASSLLHLGEVARCCGDYEEAGRSYEAALELYRQLGGKDGIASSLHNLGHVRSRSGDYASAVDCFTRGLLLFVELGDKLSIIECVAGLAGVYAATGKPKIAARLLGASEAALESLNTGLDPADQIEFERNVDLARSQVGPDLFASLWAEGRALEIDGATSLALSNSPAQAVSAS
jgi:predicted ATPase/DNA-binding XRE family transcriptional regulator